MQTTSYVFLDDIRFYAYHGVASQERLVGNEFTVNLRLQVDMMQAMATDDVAHTVNYADVHQAIKAEMEIPSRLLEHVCGRIVNRLFEEFPLVNAIDIRLSKRNPPMGADIDAAGVEMHCTR